MRHVRNILAVVLVATALCADRAMAAAAPEMRPQIGCVTRQVVGEITRRFTRVVPGIKIVQNRQEQVRGVPARVVPVESVEGVHETETTPFQFRLPPPVAR
jgi:hypothetical protein